MKNVVLSQVFHRALMRFHNIANCRVGGESTHKSSSFSYTSLFGTINIQLLHCLDSFLVFVLYSRLLGHLLTAWVCHWPRIGRAWDASPRGSPVRRANRDLLEAFRQPHCLSIDMADGTKIYNGVTESIDYAITSHCPTLEFL